MLLSSGQILDSIKFNSLVVDQAQNFQDRLPLRFLDRTATTNADDADITATFSGKVFAADLIADDQAAVVYEAGQLEMTVNAIPNLKIGKRLSQAMLARLSRLVQGAGTAGDQDMFRNWEVTTARTLVRGIDERKNALICAMQLDALAYNRLGIVINGSWGLPSAYKVTPSTLWTNVAATPVTDVLTLKQMAANDTGEVYDRLTLSTADFQNMVNTTEFKQLVQGLVGWAAATTAFNVRDARMTTFASQLLQMEIELEDKTITVQNPDGTQTSSRVLPAGKAILSSRADDNNAAAMDFGNAIVTESQVAALVGDPGNAAGGERFGPFAYYTAPPDLNPPSCTAWSVSRGFPRKFRKTATAVLTIG